MGTVPNGYMSEADMLARLIQNVAVAYQATRFRGAKLDIRNPADAQYVAREVLRMRAEIKAQ